ncbi:hypothetical protein ACC734_39350, partial [Rhizobium ruizarguesonis]
GVLLSSAPRDIKRQGEAPESWRTSAAEAEEKPCSRNICCMKQAMSEQEDKRLPAIRHGGNALQKVARLFLGLGC